MDKLDHVITIRLDDTDYRFLADAVDRFAPFLGSIAEAGRLSIKVARAVVLAAMVPWTLAGLQGLLRNLRNPEGNFEDSAEGRKPVARLATSVEEPPARDPGRIRGRARFSASRRSTFPTGWESPGRQVVAAYAPPLRSCAPAV